jgi:adenylyltransferase/sulfurtransferase
VADVTPDNVEDMISDVDLVMDGTDNFEVRFLLNDACVKHDVPWVYGGVIATYGVTMAIIPHRTPCYRCFLAEIPPPGSTPTCDTVGVLSPAVNVVASLEVAEGLKILMGSEQVHLGKFLYVDVWAGTLERLELRKGDGLCRACDLGQFEFLEATEGSYATRLCGRDAVQIGLHGRDQLSFPELAKRLDSVGPVTFNDYLLCFQADSYNLTVFPDGRAIIKGTADEALARTLYARYIGV